ncbi:MAG: nucleotidyltransferase family protein [Burkholderiales bacterium]|nr:nucleotidyltransferase family protein [Burkholderiales bacterium]
MSEHRISGPEKSPVAVLLAAGAGRRFGGGKLLHPLEDGVAMAAHAVRNLLAAGLPVTAVVRPGDIALAELLEREGCRVTICPDADRGMGLSLAHGVTVAREAGGWVVALADMPRIRPATIARIAQALAAGADIAAPAYRGDRGHPVAFGRRFLDELRALTGDSGARALVQRNQALLRLIDTDDSGVLLDIDRRDDLSCCA